MTDKKDIRVINITYDRIEIGNTLLTWVKSYEALVDSAEKIKDADPKKNFELFRVKLMLRGMALESLLKSLAISRQIKLIDVDGSLHKDFRKISHNLEGLSIELGLSLSIDETKMLAILSDSIETGRYPVPAKATSLKRFWIVPTYENLYSELIKKIESLIRIETANA